ncbi:MAG: hypothetical protein KatS3mg109_0624 [Pirellulaceae bacterium]|nr:MAG: hypothetical protein KatS3mg109_0624 [Pirellulaceae bacterium]
MGSSVAWMVMAAALMQVSGPPRGFAQELNYQKEVFRLWWEAELETRADLLPESGSVPDFRIPYCGHDYPDRGGGTIAALRKYDLAFHGGRPLASEWERRDVRGHRGMLDPERPVLFPRLREALLAGRVPSWYGHCNGWTAAAIRHAEPQRSVVRNGVVFTPADIKGLLAEIYMYTDSEFLGGNDAVIHPAIFHLSITNWIGRGEHPIGMETAIGQVVINYPVYAYKSTVTKPSPNTREVKMTVTYAVNTPREYDKGPRLSRNMYFHYLLDLDSEGHIIGGRYYSDSNRIDMLWAPLKPVQGGQPGNERGNPYVDVREVLAIWRESVPEEIRKKWLNIDPTDEDRVLPESSQEPPPTSDAAAAQPHSDNAAGSVDTSSPDQP